MDEQAKTSITIAECPSMEFMKGQNRELPSDVIASGPLPPPRVSPVQIAGSGESLVSVNKPDKCHRHPATACLFWFLHMVFPFVTGRRKVIFHIF
jgi:hypothetical protein